MNFSILKYPVLFFLAGIFISSCGSSENKIPGKTDSVISAIVARDSVQTLVINRDSVQPAKKDAVAKDSTPSYREIKGSVLYNLPYCGGARPTAEILAELAQMKPLTKSKLKLKNKSGEYFIETDAEGKFSCAIPQGKYDVYLTKEINKKCYDVSPANCENCLINPIATFYTSNPLIQFTFRCSAGAKFRP